MTPRRTSKSGNRWRGPRACQQNSVMDSVSRPVLVQRRRSMRLLEMASSMSYWRPERRSMIMDLTTPSEDDETLPLTLLLP